MISETTTMRPRPVWARYLRRQAGRPVGPPTEEEKQDALVVLSWPEPLAFDALDVEALRVMDDYHRSAG